MATETKANGMRLWLRLVLFASLALNLAVVGIFAGVLLRGGPQHEGGPRGRDAAVPYARALSEEDRQTLRAELRRAFRDRRDAAGDVASDYRAALDVLRADPFERAAFEAVMTRQDARAEVRQQAGRQALVDVLAAMTPAARQAYADRLAEQVDRLERRMERWGKD